MGRASKQHRQDVITGKVERFVSKIKGNELIGSLKDPYQTLKDTLTNSKTPESAKNDFKVRTLNQLKIEAYAYLKKYSNKEIAHNELFKTITDDAKYLEILKIVGLDKESISKAIKEDLGL